MEDHFGWWLNRKRTDLCQVSQGTANTAWLSEDPEVLVWSRMIELNDTVTVKKKKRYMEFRPNFFVRSRIPLRFGGLAKDTCPQLFQQKSQESSPTRRRVVTLSGIDTFLKTGKLHVPFWCIYVFPNHVHFTRQAFHKNHFHTLHWTL